MNNDNSNTTLGDRIASAFIKAMTEAILASPDLNKSLISLSNSIEILRASVSDSMGSVTRRLDALENAQDKGADREQDEDIAKLRYQLDTLLRRVDEVEDTVSECDGLRHRVDDLESQVEDLDAVTTDQVEDIVSDWMSVVPPITAKHIVTLGLRGLVDEAIAEDAKI